MSFGSGSVLSSLRPWPNVSYDGQTHCRIERADLLIDSGIVEPPAVVKIDVEGSEPQVIAGFGKYLSSEVLKAFIFESNGEFYDEISSLLESAGFKCSAIPSANKNETFKTVNFIALRAEAFLEEKSS
jgi:hypothetical protein